MSGPVIRSLLTATCKGATLSSVIEAGKSEEMSPHHLDPNNEPPTLHEWLDEAQTWVRSLPLEQRAEAAASIYREVCQAVAERRAELALALSLCNACDCRPADPDSAAGYCAACEADARKDVR